MKQETALPYFKGVMNVMPVPGCRMLAGPLYYSVGRLLLKHLNEDRLFFAGED